MVLRVVLETAAYDSSLLQQDLGLRRLLIIIAERLICPSWVVRMHWLARGCLLPAQSLELLPLSLYRSHELLERLFLGRWMQDLLPPHYDLINVWKGLYSQGIGAVRIVSGVVRGCTHARVRLQCWIKWLARLSVGPNGRHSTEALATSAGRQVLGGAWRAGHA